MTSVHVHRSAVDLEVIQGHGVRHFPSVGISNVDTEGPWLGLHPNV